MAFDLTPNWSAVIAYFRAACEGEFGDNVQGVAITGGADTSVWGLVLDDTMKFVGVWEFVAGKWIRRPGTSWTGDVLPNAYVVTEPIRETTDAKRYMYAWRTRILAEEVGPFGEPLCDSYGAGR